MTHELAKTIHRATTSSTDDEDLSSLLNPGATGFDANLDVPDMDTDCFPLDGVEDEIVYEALPPILIETRQTRSANLAREVLARAEDEVRDLLQQDLPATQRAALSHDIVARAQRDVSEIMSLGRAPTAQCFASLRVQALPAEESDLRYQVSGRLTLATLLAFQQAVSRLPGVNSARVEPHPDDDVSVLSMTTDDSRLVHRLLVCMPGIDLQMEAA